MNYNMNTYKTYYCKDNIKDVAQTNWKFYP